MCWPSASLLFCGGLGGVLLGSLGRGALRLGLCRARLGGLRRGALGLGGGPRPPVRDALLGWGGALFPPPLPRRRLRNRDLPLVRGCAEPARPAAPPPRRGRGPPTEKNT